MILRSIYNEDNWAILQQEKEGGVVKVYQYSNGNERVKYTFIVRKAGTIEGVQYYDILTPRGMGGPRCIGCDSINLEKYNESFLSFCKDNKIIAEYVRFDPWNNSHKIFGSLYEDLEHHGNIYCNHLDIDFFKEEYSKSVQRNIKKNIDNIQIEIDFDGKRIKEFLELYKFTEEKYTVSDYYHLSEKFISEYFFKLKGKVAIACAINKGEVISSSIILFGEDIVHYHFTGNNPLYKKLNANTIVLYKTALLAQKMKKRLFDLGGGIINGNTAEFKKLLVKEDGIYPYYVGKRVLDEEIYRRMIEINGANKSDFFPAYRRINL